MQRAQQQTQPIGLASMLRTIGVGGAWTPDDVNVIGIGHDPVEAVEPLPFSLERRNSNPSVAVVIPVFNEEAVLPLTYRRLVQTMDRLGVSWSVTFINDGSRDGTLRILEELYSRDGRVSYVALARNFGHQAALAAGLDQADADVVITMDADLQHPPELIESMLGAWRSGFDVVHTRKVTTTDLSRVRAIGTRLAYKMIRSVSSVNIIEHASDFRLLDRDAVDAMRQMPERGRLYRGLTPWIGFRQAAIPFVADARQAGSSQYGFRQLAALFSRSFFDFSRAPLQVGLVLGASAITLCFGYLAYVFVALLIGQSLPPGFVSLIFIFVFLTSVNLCFAGILGVYVARIYDEVRGRPAYVVGRRRTHSSGVRMLGADADLQSVSNVVRR